MTAPAPWHSAESTPKRIPVVRPCVGCSSFFAGIKAMPTPARMTAPQIAWGKVGAWFSQSHSMIPPKGAARHWIKTMVLRAPMRGYAWNIERSPMPNPTQPLRNKIGNAAPPTPKPNRCAHAPRKMQATNKRARFACVPLTKCESRRPVIADNEKRMVARKAANICGSVRRERT